MRAEGGSLVQITVLVAVHGHLRGPPSENYTFARFDLSEVAHLTRRDEVGVLNRDVQILFREFLDGPK